MSKRTATICLLALAVTVIGFWIYSDQTAWGQSRSSAFGSVKIGVCDPHEVFQQYVRKTALQGDLDDKKREVQAEMKAIQSNIKAKRDMLQTGTFKPETREYQNKTKELLTLTVEHETKAKWYESDLRRQDAEITRMCYEDIYKAIDTMAKKKGLTLVLTHEEFELQSQTVQELISKLYYRRPVLYADPGLDITQEVVDLVDAEYRADMR